MIMNTDNKEIECRFLDIDKGKLIEKLNELDAKDYGEMMLEEVIVYDKELEWKKKDRFVRIRKVGGKSFVSYKEHNEDTVDGAYEIEFEVSCPEKAELLLEKIGLNIYRRQQKRRHTFELDDVTVDIDTWPGIPTYVEFESDSEDLLRKLVERVGYSWEDANFNNAAWVIENVYGVPVKTLRHFTFDRMQ